jgi:hypothetical protein
MAGPAPKTHGWHALENAHRPKGWHVIVGGVVQVSATNLEPRLTETAERNPDNLGLNLTIEKTSGDGADVMVWKAVHFHKEVKRNQYNHVIVRWDVQQIANFPVLDDRECAAQAEVAMKALNQQYAGEGKAGKAAAKKPAATKAPKKAAAKKAAAKTKPAPKKKPRAVGGWAKGKKAKAKKAPKKAAKKSGLKKLVRKLVKKLRPKKKR